MNASRDETLDQLSHDPAYDDDNRDAATQLDLQYYLSILRKNKWAIALFTAVITGLAAYLAYTATPIYRATSTLQIESQKASIVSVEEFIGAQTENSDYYQTQFEILRSRRLARRLVGELELWKLPRFGTVQPAATAGGTASNAEGESGSMLDGLMQSLRDIQSDNEGSDNEAVVEGGSSVDLLAQREGGAVYETPLVGDAAELVPDPSAGTNSIPDFSVAGMRTTSSVSRYSAEEDPLTAAQFGRALGWFQSNMSIEPLRGTNLVRLSFESDDPELAAFVANAIGEQYIDSYLDSRMEMTSRASDWLSGRLGVLKTELDDAENRLIQYKQENGLVDVNGSVGRLNEQELVLATEELAAARSELASATDIVREIRDYSGQPELLESIDAIQRDPLIQQVRTEQGQRQRELDELLNRYGARHPSVVDAQSRLASLEDTMTGHVQRVTSSIEKNYQLLRQRVGNIEDKLLAGKEEILVLGTKRFELDELEREVDTKRGLYNTFYSRITEAKSADGLETANARISDTAVIPTSPVKPNKQLIIVLAALASLVLSCLLALLHEQMDTTVKGANDIEKKLGLRLLGILPLVKASMLSAGASKKLPLNPAQMEDRKGTFFESVNTIRTALSVSEGQQRRKIILVTSSIPGEGKSTVAINLAYSFAQMENVLLIDCDLRRPTVGKVAQLDRGTLGLSDLIIGTTNIRRTLHRGVFKGQVDVISAGSTPEQPLEMLSSTRFRQLLDRLATRYDRIIIDSAPTQAVSDALVLSRMADGVVYAVKSHDTDINLVKRGIERLRQVSAPLVGVVITQVDVEKLAGYGGDHYYQGYYDYYGYNTQGSPQKERVRMSREQMAQVDENDFDSTVVDEGWLDMSNDNEPPVREYRQNTQRPVAASGQRRKSIDLDIL